MIFVLNFVFLRDFGLEIMKIPALISATMKEDQNKFYYVIRTDDYAEQRIIGEHFNYNTEVTHD